MLAIGYIFVARLLRPEGYGLYALSLVAPTALVSLINLGLDSTAIRFTAKYRAEKKIRRSLLHIQFGFSLQGCNARASTILTFYGINLLVRRLKINFNIKSQPRIIAISILSAFPIIAFLKISPLTEIFNLVLCTLIYLATYFTLIPASKAINLQELQNMEQILGRIRILSPIAKLIMKYENKLLTLAQHKTC